MHTHTHTHTHTEHIIDHHARLSRFSKNTLALLIFQSKIKLKVVISRIFKRTLLIKIKMLQGS